MAWQTRHIIQPTDGEHQLFGFLTTDANKEVGEIHPKAMPVIFTRSDEVEA
jgi:putative SOS response-associated peptidase YedK